MTIPPRNRLLTALLTLPLLFATMAGCSGKQYLGWRNSEGVVVPADPYPPRGLAMFDGHEGRPLAWVDVMDAVRWADVIFLGEQHNDAVAHAVQLAIVEEAVELWPGTAVSLEMLERHEQHLVDEYLAGMIDQETFIEQTNSANWAGPGSWVVWYQPIIDAAKAHGSPVVAANAPRQYVRLARTGGVEALEQLTPAQQALFEYVHPLPGAGDPYRDRFFSLMQPAAGSAGADAHGHAMTDEQIEGIFRAQLVWDATMAGSIARALERGAPRVIHLVGQFHSDFHGANVTELRHRRRSARILTISFQPVNERELRAEDHERADIVIYTGVRRD